MRQQLAILGIVWGNLLSASALAQPTVNDSPISLAKAPVFARSGHSTAIELPLVINQPPPEIVLRAFGRTWTKPSTTRLTKPKVMRFEVVIPTVRVPTILTVVSHEAVPENYGSIVAYPDRDIDFDEQTRLLARGAPPWFVDWANVVGLPVTWLKEDSLSQQLRELPQNQRLLLILGREGAGKNWADVKLWVNNQKLNILVLDADWFGEPAKNTTVAPQQMLAGMSTLAQQKWPHPLRFPSHLTAWDPATNRWCWIAGDNSPLVEQVSPYCSSQGERQPTWVFSYLPWESQLGQDESADATFLELLTEAARATTPKRSTAVQRLTQPPQPLVNDDPVLSRIDKVQEPTEQLRILDVRGDRFPGESLWNARKLWEEMPLLILGDDERLDEWIWLKLARTKQKTHQPGVIWLPSDDLQLSLEERVRLMLMLTELGVPFVSPDAKESRS